MGQQVLSKFEPLRPGFGQMISGLLPATAEPIGRAMRTSAIDADTNARTFVVLSTAGTIPADGLLSRPSRNQIGQTDSEQLFGLTTTNGGGLIEVPFTISEQGTLIPLPDDLIVEGADYLEVVAMATGQITSATAVGTELAFTGPSGRLRVAQTGEWVQYRLLKQLTVTDTSVASNEQVRVQLQKVHQAYKK